MLILIPIFPTMITPTACFFLLFFESPTLTRVFPFHLLWDWNLCWISVMYMILSRQGTVQYSIYSVLQCVMISGTQSKWADYETYSDIKDYQCLWFTVNQLCSSNNEDLRNPGGQGGWSGRSLWKCDLNIVFLFLLTVDETWTKHAGWSKTELQNRETQVWSGWRTRRALVNIQ